MFPPLLATIVSLLPLAEPAPTGVTFNSAAVLSFILSKLVPVGLGFIGFFMLMGARKQRMSQLLEDVGKIIIIGVVITGGGLLIAFGDSLAKMIIN
jgi:heme/copper-type cytochrome/quinol oxidase subunit 4